jgi:hypothetical protein
VRERTGSIVWRYTSVEKTDMSICILRLGGDTEDEMLASVAPFDITCDAEIEFIRERYVYVAMLITCSVVSAVAWTPIEADGEIQIHASVEYESGYREAISCRRNCSYLL